MRRGVDLGALHRMGVADVYDRMRELLEQSGSRRSPRGEGGSSRVEDQWSPLDGLDLDVEGRGRRRPAVTAGI